jgi:hypothetical protein
MLSFTTVFLNMGNGTFQAVTTNVPQNYAMAVGDFNGDGKDDLVLSDGSDVFVIFYSKGDGTFCQGAQLSLGGQMQAGAFVVGDFNGDGRIDIAMALYPSNEIGMFFNQGGGIFTLSYCVTGSGAYDMRAGDLNNNGNLDLVRELSAPHSSGADRVSQIVETAVAATLSS